MAFLDRQHDPLKLSASSASTIRLASTIRGIGNKPLTGPQPEIGLLNALQALAAPIHTT